MIIINSLCWSLTLLKFIQTLDHTDSSQYRNENWLAVWVILEIFLIVSLKAHDWLSWILTECNLSWRIVKYRILSEVCMINNTVSPQMWCIIIIKGWFIKHPQILLVTICKVILSNAKNWAWFVFQEFIFEA